MFDNASLYSNTTDHAIRNFSLTSLLLFSKMVLEFCSTVWFSGIQEILRLYEPHYKFVVGQLVNWIKVFSCYQKLKEYLFGVDYSRDVSTLTLIVVLHTLWGLLFP